VSRNNNRLHRHNPDNLAVAKPGALSLLRHILRATLLDGMEWPVLFCIVLAFALYHFNIAYHDSAAILIITAIFAIGLVRGCNAWQNALNDYQRQLAMARHQQESAGDYNSIPGYFPSRRY
jgi:hypothetical protein